MHLIIAAAQLQPILQCNSGMQPLSAAHLEILSPLIQIQQLRVSLSLISGGGPMGSSGRFCDQTIPKCLFWQLFLWDATACHTGVWPPTIYIVSNFPQHCQHKGLQNVKLPKHQRVSGPNCGTKQYSLPGVSGPPFWKL